jgi:hypothetical protein
VTTIAKVFIVLATGNAIFRIGRSTVKEIVNRIKLFMTVTEIALQWMFHARKIVMVRAISE